MFTVGSSITTSTARVRVVWANPPPSFSASRDNTGDFRIEPAFLTITFPTGGERWPRTGSAAKKTITWANNLGSLHQVRIELSKDGGATFPIVILAGTSSDGAQLVTAQAGWGPTTQARIRITSVSPAPIVSSVSPNDFIIP